MVIAHVNLWGVPKMAFGSAYSHLWEVLIKGAHDNGGLMLNIEKRLAITSLFRVSEGKFKSFGLSNYSSWEVVSFLT